MFFEKYKTEKEQLEAVKEDGFTIQYIHNPSEKVQIAAVRHYGDAIQIHPQSIRKSAVKSCKA